MKKKYLRVTMPDGSRWDVPCDIIAANRAAHYSPDTSAPLYQRELQYTIEHHDEIEDWAANNMNWSDVSVHAKRVSDPAKTVDFQEGWLTGEREVVELPCA